MFDCLTEFADLIKSHYLLWHDIYVRRATDEVKKDGEDFQMMPFEYAENWASGKYNYASIVQRLHDIKGRLDKETQTWKDKGHG